MVHILQKIADWIVENEEREATKCNIPDEVIDEWLETIEEHKKRMQKNHKEKSEQYVMLQNLDKRVKEIEAIRHKKCNTQAQ